MNWNENRLAHYLLAASGVAVVTAVGAIFRDQLNDTTAALALLLVVLFVSTLWGRGPGMAASALGMLSYNFVFLRPVWTFYGFPIGDPQDWTALAIFIITASTVGHLSVSAKRREAEIKLLARLQAVVAGLGQRALLSDPAVNLLDEAVAHVARTLEVEYCKVLELLPEGKALLLRSGVGWKEGLVGRATVPSGTDSQAGFTLLADEPVVVEDLRTERRFSGPPLLHEHGVVSGLSVVISTSEGPYGVLGAHTRHLRRFTRDEVNFLQAVANVLGATTTRQRAELALRASEANLKRAQEIARLGSWHLHVLRNQLTWSDEVFRIFGIPKETELTYEKFLDMVHPDDRESVNEAWSAALHGAPYDIEHRIVVGGEVKWVRERAKVEFDIHGAALEGIGTVQDVTERRCAEEEIRKLNADLEKRVLARTAELEAANRIKDEHILREHAATAELARAREREAEIGSRIQQTLLVDQPPQDIPGLRVAALTVPSQRIDGDFYIFIKHRNQALDVIVGDVMGKGVPAALLGAATKSHFLKALGDLMALALDHELPEPKEVVTLANAGVVRHLIDLECFVTLCYARVDVSRHSLDIVDCGHTGTIHLQRASGRCKVLHGNNLPLGTREGEIYDQFAVPIEPGDLLLLFSDGITEARNPARELFGMERLEDFVRLNAGLEPEALVEAIREEVFAFSHSERLSDDLTCVAIRWEETPLPLAQAEIEIGSELTQLRRVREFVRDFCRSPAQPPLDEDGVGALELAVNEAASNIMKHAYHGRADQRISLEAEAFSSRVAIRLHHLGEPFDPSAIPAPALDGSRDSGFGVYIIKQSVDEVRYYRDERGRNCVALVKRAQSINK